MDVRVFEKVEAPVEEPLRLRLVQKTGYVSLEAVDAKGDKIWGGNIAEFVHNGKDGLVKMRLAPGCQVKQLLRTSVGVVDVSS